MPMKANVIIKYGPYNSNGIVEYKTERLEGLQKFLTARGHKIIELRKANNWNNVEIIVNEENVFKCKLNDLEFGGDGELDPIVMEAEKMITKAF
ncbi:unnamed protein product [Brachionus calyciflorus]|uniref:Uncharacterized protein n=1 Tax=Brachionus calyciflorus TaxID=104777 RepID=A0A813M9I6_9BILA|nr:unnamed protein product [Brachionus calyciflorus]